MTLNACLFRAIVGTAGIGSLASSRPAVSGKEDRVLRSIRQHLPRAGAPGMCLPGCLCCSAFEFAELVWDVCRTL